MSLKLSHYNVFFADEGGGGAIVGYNAASGAFIAIEPTEQTSLEALLADTRRQGQAPPEADPSLQRFLQDHGLLVPKQVDEVKALEGRNASWKDESGLILTVSLTQACNFDCPYCFEPHIPNTEISAEVQQRIVDFVARQAPTLRTVNIDWYGGEPLLALDQLISLDARIRAVCDAHGAVFRSSISTNGSLLTEEVAQRLASQTSVQSVRICVDGPEAIHDAYRPMADGNGSFQLIWRNLEAASAHLQVKLRINVDKDNAATVPDLLEQVRHSRMRLDNVVIAIKPIISSRLRPRSEAFSPREWSRIEPALKNTVLDMGLALDLKEEKSCGHCVVFSTKQYMVDSAGNLYKCSDTFAPDEAVGVLRDRGEIELHRERLDPWLEFPTKYDSQCRSCAALPLCMGGCTFRRFASDSNWCGAERYNLKGYARLRYRQALRQGRVAFFTRPADPSAEAAPAAAS